MSLNKNLKNARNNKVDLRQYLGHKKVKSVSEQHPFMERPVSSETSQVKDRT